MEVLLWLFALHTAFASGFVAPHTVSTADALPVWRNWTLPTAVRVQDLISRLSLDTKLAQLSSNAPAIPSLGIESFDWGHEALHGVVNKLGYATVFPQPIALAATWDVDLIRAIGNVVSDEGRGITNNGTFGKASYGLSVWAPNVNVFRDPRWGRGHETYGECPRLSAAMQIEYVKGLQQGLDETAGKYWKLLSTPKHFAAYNLEEYAGISRHEFDAVVAARDMVDSYLPVFEGVIREGGAHGVMCSYNSINGVPSCANAHLLQEVLRRDMGFTGHVVSDCGAIVDVFQNHHFNKSQVLAAAESLNAGTDLDCGNGYASLNSSAVSSGLISESVLNQSMTRLFTARMKLGEFDPANLQPYRHIPPTVVNSKEHRALAATAAREGIVLLKNSGLLPINLKDVHNIAVIGPHCNDTQVLLGNYHGIPSKVVTPLDAITAAAAQAGVSVVYNLGVAIEGDGIFKLEDVIQLARHADVVIMCVGLSAKKTGSAGYANGYVYPALEKESLDRYTLELPGIQRDLIMGIHVQTTTPIALVSVNGGAVDLSWELQNLPAVMEAWYGGEEGGQAVSDALFGAVVPAGRMPITTYREAYIRAVDYADMSFTKYPGRTYRYLQDSSLQLLPFAFGLSYSNFTYTNVSVFPSTAGPTVNRTLRVTLGNLGPYVADHVVVAFVTPKSVSIPVTEFGVKQLLCFERVHDMKSGTTLVVECPFRASMLSYVNSDAKRVITPGVYTVMVGIAPSQLPSYALGNNPFAETDITIS